MYTLWHHCRIATMAAGHYQLLDDGAMLTVAGERAAAYPGAVPGRRNGARDQIRLRPGSG